MMNGRHRCGHGIVSHESGRTSRKKIAKVAVGKSTARASLCPRAGRVEPAVRARCASGATAPLRRSPRRLVHRGREARHRGHRVACSASRKVCSTGGRTRPGRRPAARPARVRTAGAHSAGSVGARGRPFDQRDEHPGADHHAGDRDRSRARRSPPRRPRRRGRGLRAGAAAAAGAGGRAGVERAEPGVGAPASAAGRSAVGCGNTERGGGPEPPHLGVRARVSCSESATFQPLGRSTVSGLVTHGSLLHRVDRLLRLRVDTRARRFAQRLRGAPAAGSGSASQRGSGRDSESFRRSSPAGSSRGRRRGWRRGFARSRRGETAARARRCRRARHPPEEPSHGAVHPVDASAAEYGCCYPSRGFLPRRARRFPGGARPGGADSDRRKERGNT